MLLKIFMILNKIKFGEKLKIKGFPVIYKSKKSTLIIGNNVTIKSGFLSNLIGLYQRTIIITRTDNSFIKIGNNVGMSGATIYAREKIVIGDNTLIGANVKILDNDFHPVNNAARLSNDDRFIKSAPVMIGKNCFIGVNSIILKGSTIGDNTIVGAGSIVSGNFGSNLIIGGNPARIIKVNNDEDSSN
jgi:acetyltransferase-like isoleucine patch superfamily enzyme